MTDLLQSIGKLAGETRKLARIAAQQYSTEVETILNAQSRDARRIERCLDGMLDFCFDHDMLVLYKKLCRYYFDIEPKASVSYVQAYKEMWEGESKKVKLKRQKVETIKRSGKRANGTSCP